MAKPAVIVVNSVVVRGSVGGRATGFVLERLGFPVWAVPTVILPWHPGHGRATRIAASAEAFDGLIADLAGSDRLGEVGAVVTGYFAGAEQVASAARLVGAVKAANPEVVYLCDPIIGDSAGLFQPAAVAAAIRDVLLPLADIATPNRHELCWLAGVEAAGNSGLVAAARALGPGEMVVTSAFTGEGRIGNLWVDRDTAILASHRRLAEAPHGTGDLFAALFFAHRLGGAAGGEALARAASATLGLVEQAGRLGADEMPLAAGQAVFLAAPSGVVTETLAEPA